MPQHVDMLQYIYINKRVLNRILRRNATPEELMEVEDKAAEVEEGYNSAAFELGGGPPIRSLYITLPP